MAFNVAHHHVVTDRKGERQLGRGAGTVFRLFVNNVKILFVNAIRGCVNIGEELFGCLVGCDDKELVRDRAAIGEVKGDIASDVSIG